MSVEKCSYDCIFRRKGGVLGKNLVVMSPVSLCTVLFITSSQNVVGSSHSTCTKQILIPLLFLLCLHLSSTCWRGGGGQECCCSSAQSVVSLSCLPAALAQYLFSPDLLCYKAKHWCDASTRSTVSFVYQCDFAVVWMYSPDVQTPSHLPSLSLMRTAAVSQYWP